MNAMAFDGDSKCSSKYDQKTEVSTIVFGNSLFVVVIGIIRNYALFDSNATLSKWNI